MTGLVQTPAPTAAGQRPWFLLFPLLIMLAVGGTIYAFQVRSAQEDATIAQKGLGGTALVLQAVQTNEEYQGKPVVAFRLRVIPAASGSAPFETDLERPVDIMQASRFQAGTTHPVRYLADDVKRIRFAD